MALMSRHVIIGNHYCPLKRSVIAYVNLGVAIVCIHAAIVQIDVCKIIVQQKTSIQFLQKVQTEGTLFRVISFLWQ